MIPKPISINGHAINDGVNYYAFWPESTIYLGPTGTPNIVPRAYAAPMYVNTIRDSSSLPLHIFMLGDIPSQSDQLRGWLNPILGQPVTLILYDTANANEPWQLDVIVRNFAQLNGSEYTVTLDIPDMVRKRVAQSHLQVTPVASPATMTITPGGNYQTNPIFKFTPTSAKGGSSFPFQWFVPLYNNTVNPFNKYGFDIASDAFDTAALVVDPVHSNQINLIGGITAVAVTIPVDTPVGGGLGWLSPAGMGFVDSEQISWTGISGGNLTGCTRGIGGTTAAVHADNAVINFSYVQANGADMRVYIDGNQVDRWFDGFKTTTTKIWCNIDLPANTRFSLGVGIAGGGAVSSITVTFPNTTSGSAASFNALPSSGIVQIDTGGSIEIYTYTGKSSTASTGTFTGTTRATKTTTAHAHSVGATVYFIPHDIWIYSGDPTLTAQITNDANKPMTDLSTSTNASLVYTSFFDGAGQRSNRWTVFNNGPNVPLAHVYTAPNDAQADPATAIGAAFYVYTLNGKFYFGGSNITASITNPCGINTITVTGEKKRVGVSWFSSLIASVVSPGLSVTTLWSEVAPTTGAGFVAWAAHAVVSCANNIVFQIGFSMGSQVASITGGIAAAALLTATVVPTTAGIPTVQILTLNTSYDLNATLSNAATGNSVIFRVNMPLNAVATVDTDAHTITLSTDGSSWPVQLDDQARFNWLPLLGGVANVLTLTDPGLTGLTWDAYWNDRLI